ncbi:hypothetical protein CPB83DRAFT_550093 [Crepidotus variabilis]|uniref:Uncharacterized protein n=1 Tax=Crepidotus variabilis TaxID=179855 RepID=A0A9P6E9W5_9AGAR|nr:hypothetical protein CPB83DRAFT_550093 [Crepidotus variabilis]
MSTSTFENLRPSPTALWFQISSCSCSFLRGRCGSSIFSGITQCRAACCKIFRPRGRYSEAGRRRTT